MWVELVEGVIYCYESPYGGLLTNTIDCKLISDIEEIIYDKLEISIEAIKITLMNADPNLPPTELLWGWADDRTRLKKLWRRSLVYNHGSGIVSMKTASSIRRDDKLLNETDNEEGNKGIPPSSTFASTPTTAVRQEGEGETIAAKKKSKSKDRNPQIQRSPR